MRTQTLSIDIERRLGIDLGQTIADKVGRNHPTRQRLGNGFDRPGDRRTSCTTLRDHRGARLGYSAELPDRIGKEIRLGLVSRVIAGGDSLRG